MRKIDRNVKVYNIQTVEDAERGLPGTGINIGKKDKESKNKSRHSAADRNAR